MLRIYLKLAWRNLIRNKVYSGIHLVGLTVGMTCFIMIALYIQFELSFDTHHANADRIYRVVQQQKGNEISGTDFLAVSPRPVGIAMKKDFPEVEAFTNIDQWGASLIKDNEAYDEIGLYADEYLFDVFDIAVIEGIGTGVLDDPNSILLTETLAKKIFGAESAVEKTILYNGERMMTVKGIVSDPPKNQHFHFSYIASIKMGDQYDFDIDRWISNNYYTYVLLSEGHNYENLQEKMRVYEKITKPAFATVGFMFHPEFTLQPLKDIHLHSNMNSELGINGDIDYVYFFTFIAFIILFLAAINYMNLATAKSAQRAKEVGVNKVLGARRGHLILQFLGESSLFTLLSFCIAAVLSFLLLPVFNEMLDKSIPFDLVGNWWILIGMLFIGLLVGVMSGLYPALFLSSVSPVKALKGNFLKSHKEGALIRNSLVVGQFVVAMALAVGSIVVHQQLQFTKNKKLGYTIKQIVHVPYWEKEIAQKEDVLTEQLLAHPKIHKASFSRQLPMNITNKGPVDVWEGNVTKEQLYIYRNYVDYDYIDVLEMELVEGRAFSKEFATDATEAYILNETAIKKLGWKTAVGKTFNDGRVIGVIKDFHLQTFNMPIEPMFMKIRREEWDKNHGHVILKIDSDDIENTRAFIETTMKAIVPLAQYEAKYMEDSYAALYEEESRLGKAFNIFAFLALFIAGMGLFGLISFQVVQRTKEIGIRKVLGSSVSDIVRLLSKDFLKLIIISLVIAIPIAYYFMNNWLQEYAYRIDIEWWVFALVGLAALAISFITISFQSIKAGIANPIKSLRTE